jgi:hypothetical protein
MSFCTLSERQILVRVARRSDAVYEHISSCSVHQEPSTRFMVVL